MTSRPTGEEGAALLTAKPPAVVPVIHANGADNLAAHAPLFPAQEAAGIALTMGALLVLVALWCVDVQQRRTTECKLSHDQGLCRTPAARESVWTAFARPGVRSDLGEWAVEWKPMA